MVVGVLEWARVDGEWIRRGVGMSGGECRSEERRSSERGDGMWPVIVATAVG